MKNDGHRRGFVLGVVHAAWFLNRMHGEDGLAEELLLELGPSLPRLQRIASSEDYRFKAGFWATLKRRRARNQGLVPRRSNERIKS